MPDMDLQKQTFKDPLDVVYYYDIVEPYEPVASASALDSVQVVSNSGNIGTWEISEKTLASGNVTLDAYNEQIRLGAATAPGTGIGVFIGLDGATGYDFRAGDPAGDYVWWDASAATLTISGTLSATTLIGGEIHIPDIDTTASSFHTNTTGTSWWGATQTNFNADANNAPAWINASGAARFASVTITGSSSAGGWNIIDGYIYNLQSGTPTAIPNDGVVLASGNEAMTIYEGTAARVIAGYLSASVYGLRVFATDGSTVIFEASDTRQVMAGWSFTDTSLYNLATGTPAASPNNGLVLTANATPSVIAYEGTAIRARMGYLSAGVFGFLGFATDGTTKIFEMSDTQQMVGGWFFTDTVLRTGATDAASNVLIDSANSLFRLGPTTGDYITLDGANLRMRSSNYVSGALGAGFTLEPDLFEVGNASIRGRLQMATFVANSISAVNGDLAIIQGSDTLTVDMTALDASTITIDGDMTLAVNDRIRIKEGANDEWMIVTVDNGGNNYTVTRDAAGVYAADTNPVWTTGSTVVNYGPSGAGGLFLTASDTNAPFISVFTHAGSPWSATTTRARLGNLNGYLGYVADIYGLGIGSSGAGEANITIEPTNGIQMRSGTTTLFQIDMSGSSTIGGWVLGATSFTDAAGVVGISSAVTGGDDIRIWSGDATPANAEFRVYESGAMVASSATITGAITATSGSITGAFTIGTSGTFSSGQTAYDTGTGWWMEYNGGTPRVSLGNSSGNKLTWDGTSLTIAGALSASTIDIGGADASSFHVDIDGNMWLGAATFAAAPAKVSNAGAATFASITLSTNVVLSGLQAGSSVDGQYLAAASVVSAAVNVALRGWTQDCAFSVTDADTVAWGAGTFTASDGTAYSIGASNTGNMAAKTYIYLDIGTSTTAYQVSTTATDAVGNGKVLVAIAQNATGEATFMLLNNNSYNIDAANIVAGSITANEIAGSTITADKMNVSQLSAIAADLGTINAGTVTGATIQTASSGDRFVMTSSTFRGIETGGNVIFEIVLSGGNAGDVIMGDDATSQYAMWDDSAGTFTVNGSAVSHVNLFGDGSDGAVTISANTTLTRDMFYTTLGVSTTFALHTAGYRVFAKTSITTTGTGSIDNNGEAGAASATGGDGGGVSAGSTTGGFMGGGGAGGNGSTGAGTNGTNRSNVFGGGAGGNSGAAGVNSGGTGGTVAAPSATFC